MNKRFRVAKVKALTPAKAIAGRWIRHVVTVLGIWTAALAVGVALPALAQSNAAPVLHVGNPVAAQFEDGAPLGGVKLVPGEIVYFSFTAENYKRSETGKVVLTGRVQIFDPRGTSISPAEEIPLITNLSEEDRSWKARLRAQVAIPPIALPGTYRVKFDATDEQSHQTAAGEATFQVDAKNVAPAEELTIRELNFYRGQDDETPLRTPTYRQGDMVWVKFYITGYKYGGQNSIDASYDVDVIGTDGKPILHQEDAAMEKSMSYYPQPYIPAVFNLSLKSTMSRIVYTLVITAHDAMGKQTAVARAEFQVN
jgi:hypothetical protein